MLAGAGADARQRAGLSGLARGGLLNLAGSAVAAVAGVLLVLVVTRNLSQDVAGSFFTLTSLLLLAEVVARLGTGTGLVWAVSRARALGALHHIPGLLRIAVTPVVGTSLVLSLGMVLAAEPLSRLAGGSRAQAAAAVLALAVVLPVTALSEVFAAGTRAHGTMLPTVSVDRVGRSLLQLGLVALAVGSGSLTVLTTAWAAPGVLSALVLGWWLLRLQRPLAADGAGDRPSRREFWSFTAPRALTSVVQLALQRLDIVLLAVLAGPAEAAIYTAATRFLVVGQFVNQALAGVVEPRLGRLLALDDRAATGAVFRTATGWLVLLCWPMYLVVAAVSDGLLDWFGAGYDAGVAVVLVLAASMLVASAAGPVDVVLIMAGRTRSNLANALVALAVNVVVDLMLIPSMGTLGAAVGWAAAIVVKNLLALGQVWRSLGLLPFGGGALLAMAMSVACFGVLPWTVRALLGGGWESMALAVSVGGVLYLAGCRRWRRVLALDALRRND